MTNVAIRKILKLNKTGAMGVNITEFLKELGIETEKDNYVSVGIVGQSIHINQVVIS